MNQENNTNNTSRLESEEKSRADESLQDSLDDVIASLIDLDEEDASESSAADQSLMDKGLQNAVADQFGISCDYAFRCE